MKIDGRCHCGFITFEAESIRRRCGSATAPIARRSRDQPSALWFPHARVPSRCSRVR